MWIFYLWISSVYILNRKYPHGKGCKGKLLAFMDSFLVGLVLYYGVFQLKKRVVPEIYLYKVPHDKRCFLPSKRMLFTTQVHSTKAVQFTRLPVQVSDFSTISKKGNFKIGKLGICASGTVIFRKHLQDLGPLCVEFLRGYTVDSLLKKHWQKPWNSPLIRSMYDVFWIADWHLWSFMHLSSIYLTSRR